MGVQLENWHCDITLEKSEPFINPNPVTQLGAVPVKGVPTIPSNKISRTSQNCDCNVVIPATGFTRPQPISGWNLASNSCNICIANHYQNGAALKKLCQTECQFNSNASKPVYDSNGNIKIQGATGQTPSNICLDVNYGDAPTPQSVHNIPDIQYLNTLLVGSDGIITRLDPTNKMSVLKNYFLGGAEWTDVSKIKTPSQKFDTELVGSTALANSTLESYTQYDANHFF